MVEIAVDLKPYRGDYSTEDVKRTIPTDDEINNAITQIKNPGWRWVSGMMATYGLRDHECWYTTLSQDEDCVILANVSDRKTGARIASIEMDPGQRKTISTLSAIISLLKLILGGHGKARRDHSG
jgi:hypothetical protein